MKFFLMQGDCLKEMDHIDDNCIDLVLTDLPYGMTACKWDSVIDLKEMWKQLNRVIKPKTPLIFTASQPFTSRLVMSNIEHFRHEWIYQKKVASNFAQARMAPMKEHESVLVFGLNRVRYFPIKEKRQGLGLGRAKYRFPPSCRNTSGEFTNIKHNIKKTKSSFFVDEFRFPSSVRVFNNKAKGNVGLHPNQKPIQLMEYLIETYTEQGDLVLDFTMGSGTTGVACANLDRDFIGIELDEKYFEVAKDRITKEKLKEILARKSYLSKFSINALLDCRFSA